MVNINNENVDTTEEYKDTCNYFLKQRYVDLMALFPILANIFPSLKVCLIYASILNIDVVMDFLWW